MQEIKEIQNEDYQVTWEPEDYQVKENLDVITVHFNGELALGGPKEYQPIKDLLNDLVDQEPNTIALNLGGLKFCNSSAISMLSKFVLGLRKKKDIQVVVVGSNDIPWQLKSLKNLQKLLPSLQLQLD
ncbi:MAG: hypothetical protein QNJ68_17105 [Microcoleaceae cyanobacterium MO_207.B10]|nr:hypothetical protein [Microcoleaceae cyanobacterium MO_207.B10]